MSTLLYANMTTMRDEAKRGRSEPHAPPGTTRFVDTLAALVPVEVLTLHGLILSLTTETRQGSGGVLVTEISEPLILAWAFFGLLTLSVVLYVVPRMGKIDRLDWFRMAIPPLAFVAWTMLQRATAFDAVGPNLGEAPRTIIALFLAAILGVVATTLATKADGGVGATRERPSP